MLPSNECPSLQLKNLMNTPKYFSSNKRQISSDILPSFLKACAHYNSVDFWFNNFDKDGKGTSSNNILNKIFGELIRFLKIYVCVILQIQRNTIPFVRSSHQRCAVKKGILRNFAKLTGKYQCQLIPIGEMGQVRL